MTKQLLAWIRYAIEFEEKGISFYTKCYAKTKNHYKVDLFRFLLGEESRHSKVLTQVLNAVSEGNKKKLNQHISDFKKIKIKNPLFPKKDIKKLSDPKTRIIEILNKSIDFEEEGILFYSKLEKKETNQEIKSFFKRLANDEGNHKRTIKEFGFSLQNIKLS